MEIKKNQFGAGIILYFPNILVKYIDDMLMNGNVGRYENSEDSLFSVHCGAKLE